jgi:putative tricarboxylic transport membrane protein
MTFGLMISTVGEDVMGVRRFTYGYEAMWDGIQFLAVTLGLFAVSEVVINAKRLRDNQVTKVLKHRLYISFREFKESVGAIFRGGTVGFLIGLLPGAGAGIAAFISYAVERQVSKTPEKFGTGMIQGVVRAGPFSNRRPPSRR